MLACSGMQRCNDATMQRCNVATTAYSVCCMLYPLCCCCCCWLDATIQAAWMQPVPVNALQHPENCKYAVPELQACSIPENCKHAAFRNLHFRNRVLLHLFFVVPEHRSTFSSYSFLLSLKKIFFFFKYYSLDNYYKYIIKMFYYRSKNQSYNTTFGFKSNLGF